MIDTTLAWLATYLIHSSALILAVWGFTRWCALDSLTRSLLWKIALVGGLFTATLQTGLGVQPALGNYAVTAPPTPPPIETIAIEEELEEVEDAAREVVVLEIDDGAQSVTIVSMHGGAGPAWEPMPMLPEVAPATAVVAAQEEGSGGVGAALVGLFLGGAILGLGRLVFTARRLRRLLHGRTDILRGSLAERLAVLLGRARLARRTVRLTMSPALVSPIALASREIVVPEAAFELEARQQEAMLAHELAHVVRQDPAWLVLAAVIEAVLFVQPLNRLARAGMQEAAEELADDWAVRHLGTGLHLARCLTEVASWQGRGGPGPFVSGMASGDSSALVQRVQRLLDDRDRERGPWSGVGRLFVGGLLLAAVAWGAPGISVAMAQPSPAVIEAPELPEPPEPPEPPEFDGDELEPVMAMNVVSGDSVVSQATTNKPTARQKRMLRRAARLERKAEKQQSKATRLREQGGEAPRDTHITVDGDDVRVVSGGQVVIVRGDHDDDEDADRGRRRVVRIDREQIEHMRSRGHGPHGPHFDRAEIDRIREQAREQAREARRIHSADAERMREQAREQAREWQRVQPELEAMQREAEAMGRRARAMKPADVEALRRQAEAMARSAPRFSQEELEKLRADAQRMAEEATRLSAEDVRRIEDAARVDTRELERAVRRAIEQAPGIDGATKRRIEAELQRELGKLGEKSDKARDKAREKADRDREAADKAREKADKVREKAREKADKAREAAADKAREKAERKGR